MDTKSTVFDDTQNMSESEKSLDAAAEEEQNEEVIQKGAEARAEQEVMGGEAISPTAEEDQEMLQKRKSRNKNS